MTREALVDEGGTGRQQVHDAAIFTHNAREKQFRLLLEGKPQIVIEIRKLVGVGMNALKVSQVQPLAGKIRRQSVRPRIGQHPTSLFFKVCGLTEAISRRQLDQGVVRDAAPKEK